MSKPIQVLVVEDNEDDAALVLHQLKRDGFTPAALRVQTPEELRTALASGNWSIVLTDWALPRMTGLETVQIVKGLKPALPVIIVSGTIGEETAVDGMKAGADDYLMKGRLVRLGAAVDRALREAEVRKAKVAYERQQELMVRELDHRVKNNLAAVLAIAEQTASRSETVPDFIDTFRGRIQAMARLHDMLAQRQWSGADLARLVKRTLEPYAEQAEGRIVVQGDNVFLPARAVSSVSMALHELATNAAKYGALSTPGGRIEVKWERKHDRTGHELVELLWEERGGPLVATPTRRGFGMELIEAGVAHDIAGHADLQFAPDGLRCRLSLPLAD